jgi:hypothetical protein
MFTMDLEQPTSGDQVEACSRIVRTAWRISILPFQRETLSDVSGMTDDSGRTVNFEIVWVDDTTFLVPQITKDENTSAEAEEEVVARSRTTTWLPC